MIPKVTVFFQNEKSISKFIFTILAAVVFSLIFGPSVYAQFMRQTGSSGYGFGYGFGYGSGYGADEGMVYGYRSDVSVIPGNIYGYGFGFGYFPVCFRL